MITWCVCTCFCAHLISWYARITLHPHTPRSALRQNKKVKVTVNFIVICSKLHGNNSDIKMRKMREKVRQTCFLCRLKAELVQLNRIRTDVSVYHISDGSSRALWSGGSDWSDLSHGSSLSQVADVTFGTLQATWKYSQYCA